MNKKTILSKDFLLVAVGQIISLFGNQILRYALPLYLLNKTGSSVLFGSIMASSFIPMILLFPIGGIIADRFNKRNIMVILDFSTAILIFMFYLLSGKMDIVLLMAITLIILYGIQGAYQPAVKSSIPTLLDKEYIMKGNSIVDVINSLGNMIGPVIGGILYSIVGLTPILYVSIACFFLSALMEMFINIPFEREKVKGNILSVGFNDLKESFTFMFKKKPVLLKVSLVFSCVNLLLTTLILVGLPVLITQHLGFEANKANRLYGYAQGVMAFGSILGGLLAGVFSKKLKLKTSPLLLIGCSLSVLIGGIALQLLKDPIKIYIALVLGGVLLLIFSTLFSIQIMTYQQILTPKNLTGKVISCVMCICMCTNPLGQFIYGVVFDKIGNRMYLPFYVAGFIMIGISIFTSHIFYEIDGHMEEKANSNL
ncbi:MFS transporter [Clostridium sp. CCUG 7971]|nr:MFS transporter [Clostridium sp. CCUG 7971]